MVASAPLYLDVRTFMTNKRLAGWIISLILIALVAYFAVGMALFYNSKEQTYIVFNDPNKSTEQIQYAWELRPRWPSGDLIRSFPFGFIYSIESTIWYPMHSKLIKMDKYRSVKILNQGTDHVKFIPIDRREADELYANHLRLAETGKGSAFITK